MSARHSQGYATWLIMLPLLIVPLIAVFGVPQFTPISAQTADGADGEEPELQFELGEDAPLAEAVPPFPGGSLERSSVPSSSPPAIEQWTDPFEHPTQIASLDAPNEKLRRSPASSAPENGFRDPFNRPAGPVSPVPADAARTQPQPAPRRADAGIDGYSRHPAPRENSSITPESGLGPGAQLTWRDAVAQLNKLGVQKFQLSQTEEPFVFQFVCDLSRPDNPRVTHRFEAKAGEPLKAVENVIQQVETWSAQQTPR